MAAFEQPKNIDKETRIDILYGRISRGKYVSKKSLNEVFASDLFWAYGVTEQSADFAQRCLKKARQDGYRTFISIASSFEELYSLLYP